MFTGKSSINVGTVCSHVISIAVLSRLPEGQGAFEGVSLSPQMRKEWPASPVSKFAICRRGRSPPVAGVIFLNSLLLIKSPDVPNPHVC